MKQSIFTRVFLLTFLSLLCFMATYAQWVPVRNIYAGTIANDGAVSFSIGGKGYVLAGSSTNKLYQYDTSSNTWTDKGAVPADMGHAFAMSFVLNNKAYIVGGDTGGHTLATVYCYDPAASSPWIKKANFPAGPRDAGFSFAVNGAGYIGAGFDGAAVLSDMWKYNAAADTWSLLSTPAISLIFPSAFVIGNKAYITTGGTGPSGVNETPKLWIFDPATNGISPGADFAGGGRQACFAFSNAGYGYVGGGMTGYTTTYTDMYRYKPATNTWGRLQNAPLVGPAWSSAFVIGNTAYVGLGAAFTSTGLIGTDSFFRYAMTKPTVVAQMRSQEYEWVIYPNPVADVLHLSGNVPHDAKVAIYNSLGARVKEVQIAGSHDIDVKDLPSSTYSLTLTSSTGTSTRLFIK